MDIPRIQIIRYAGNKSKLLPFLLPLIKREMKDTNATTFVDLFTGTCSVSYALKSHYTIISNDVQEYSAVIGRAILENDKQLSTEDVARDISCRLVKNPPRDFRFFSKNYTDTFFSKKQCLDIDRIRYAISSLRGKWKKNMYLVSLISAMSSCVSSPGHFAEYFPKEKASVERSKSILEHFLKKSSHLNIVPSKNPSNNKFILGDYKKAFSSQANLSRIANAGVIYADPPYSSSHYSRYYHLLETAVKYDEPQINLSVKGRYRPDRHFSEFSKKGTVMSAFEEMFRVVSQKSDATLMLSYVNSGRGLLSESVLKNLAGSYYSNIKVKRAAYTHSMHGGGKPKKVEEYVLVCK